MTYAVWRSGWGMCHEDIALNFFFSYGHRWNCLRKIVGERPISGSTLARCSTETRIRVWTPNVVSYAKIEVAFGTFWTFLACSWSLLGRLGVTRRQRGVLGAPEPVQWETSDSNQRVSPSTSAPPMPCGAGSSNVRNFLHWKNPPAIVLGLPPYSG